MIVLITGICGFIGHNLALYLYRRGYRVIGIDNFRRSNPRAIELLRDIGVEVHNVDTRDYKNIKKLLRDVDVVVHAAAYIDVYESFENPILYADNNVVGTVSLAKACIDNSVDRIIYLSSAAVYGEPIKLPITEDHPCRPISPYGVSKYSSELFIKSLSKVYRLRYVILRLFNVYGPGQEYSSYSGVIVKFITRICRDKAPVIYGDGEQTRDFVYIDDVVRAIESSIKTKYVNEVFNIATSKPTKIKDLAYLIMKLCNKNLKPIYVRPRSHEIRPVSYTHLTLPTN